MGRNWLKHVARKRKGKGRKSAPKLTFAKRVLKVVNTQRELKVAVLRGELPILGQINGNSVLQVMPDVPQAGNVGTGNAIAQEFVRDGNSITLKKIIIRGWITQKVPVDGSRSRYVVRHMIVRQRSADAQLVLANNGAEFQFNQLLENAQPFIGDITSLQTPINKSAFVSRYDRRHYLSSPTVNQAQLDIDADQLNNFKMMQKTLTFGKGMKLNYGTGGSPKSQNFPYVMTLGAATVDGVPADSGLTFNYTATAYFFDS
ncbi:MAG: putative capsid protein [Violenivirus cotis]|uniref:Putative capsid protein n=1 Tax=Circoviridae sp. TaxID=1954248 RepID=A0A345MXC3_9VIRU|nr:MAG: putative capsid protein [Circoviridae sp.]